MHPKSATVNSQEALLSRMRGQKVLMPDFSDIVESYPSKVNPFYPESIIAANLIIDSIYANEPKKQKRMRKADFGLFASYVYPEAQLEQLQVLTYWVIWVFAWDDECDLLDGHVTMDVSKGDEFRDHTLDVIESSLGLSDLGTAPSTLGQKISDTILASFANLIGPAICKAYTPKQRELCYAELTLFLHGTKTEQEERLQGKIFGVEEYIDTRREVSGSGLVIVMLEFMLKMQADRKWKDDAQLNGLWEDSVLLMWIINDIVSLRKELANDTAVNLIPVKFMQSSSLQQAFDESAVFNKAVISRFEETAKIACQDVEDDTVFVPGERARLVNAMRDMWAGNHHWHFQTPRYGFNKEFYSGSFEFTL